MVVPDSGILILQLKSLSGSTPVDEFCPGPTAIGAAEKQFNII